jgi:hypothetical protein
MPTAMPPASPSAIELARSRPEICASTVMIPASPTTNATDISKLQVINSIVCPRAIMPRIDTAHIMLRRFLGVRNTSDKYAPAITRRMRRASAV